MRRFSEKSTDNFQTLVFDQSYSALEVTIRRELFRSLRRSIRMTPVIALLILALSGAVLAGAIKSGITTDSGISSGLDTGAGFAQSNGVLPMPGKAFLISTINVGSLSPLSQQES